MNQGSKLIKALLVISLICINFGMLSGISSGIANAKTVERIAAIVNNEVILYSEVVTAAESWQGMLLGIKNQDERQIKELEIHLQVLDLLIEDMLMEQQISAFNLEVSETEIDEAIERVMKQNNIPDMKTMRMALDRQGIEWDNYRLEVAKQMLKWRFISAKFSSRVKVSEEEAMLSYQKEIDKESSNFEYRASHILFRVAKTDDEKVWDEKKLLAKSVLKEVKAGGDFSTLAGKYSEGPTSRFGGDLGYFRKGVMVKDFEAAVVQLAIGQTSGIVQSSFGYHIILLTDKRVVPGRSFEEAEPEIRQKLRETAMRKEMAIWIKQTKNRAFIDIKLDRPEKQVNL